MKVPHGSQFVDCWFQTSRPIEGQRRGLVTKARIGWWVTVQTWKNADGWTDCYALGHLLRYWYADRFAARMGQRNIEARQ